MRTTTISILPDPDMRASLTRFLAHIPELVPLALKHWHSPLCLSLKGGVPSVIPFASSSPVHSRKNTNVQNGKAPASSHVRGRSTTESLPSPSIADVIAPLSPPPVAPLSVSVSDSSNVSLIGDVSSRVPLSCCSVPNKGSDCRTEAFITRRGACCLEDAVFSRTPNCVGRIFMFCYAVFVRASPWTCSEFWPFTCWPSQALNSSSRLKRTFSASVMT